MDELGNRIAQGQGLSFAALQNGVQVRGRDRERQGREEGRMGTGPDRIFQLPPPPPS